MTIKQRYDSAVGLLRLLRHDSRASCDVVFASPGWKCRHAAHAHILSLASPKLAQDLDALRRAAAAENNNNNSSNNYKNIEVVIDVPDDVGEEAFVLFLDYLYCIEDPNESHGLTSQIAPTLLHLAIHYSVPRLISDIEEFFLKELSQINLLQYHDIALEAQLTRLQRSCRRMLTHSPQAIERGLREGSVDIQQVVDIFSLTSLPLREPDLFRAFVAWCHLHDEDTMTKLKSEFKHFIRFHELLTTDEDRIFLEESSVLSSAELLFILNRHCCGVGSSNNNSRLMFAHERRTFVHVLRANHSRWGEFSVRINRLDFVKDVIRRYSRVTGFRPEMIVLNHEGAEISEEPDRGVEHFGLSKDTPLSILILLRLRIEDQDSASNGRSCVVRVPPGSLIAEVAGAIAVQLRRRDPDRPADVVIDDDIVQVFRRGEELSPGVTVERCGIVFDDVLGFRTHQRLYFQSKCPAGVNGESVLLNFRTKTYRNLDWSGDVVFPVREDELYSNNNGLVATLRCEGISGDGVESAEGRRHFRCHVTWVRIGSERGRVLAVSTPTLPYVFSDDEDNDNNKNSLKVSISAPFSSAEVAKLCRLSGDGTSDDNNDNNQNGDDNGSNSVVLYIDFCIENVEWYGDWQL